MARLVGPFLAPFAGLVLVVLVGCATSSTIPPRLGPGVHPWLLPPEALGTQRIYRGSYDGPEGDGAFRATLRLVAADRFRLDLADRLGRPLATLAAEGERTWWLDHRSETYCGRVEALQLPGLGSLPLSAGALPALLLGVLPVAPAGEPVENAGELDFDDAGGRRWTAKLAGGQVEHWTLWDAEGPLWWWRRNDDGALLSQRRPAAVSSGRQLRWQLAVAEPLAGPPAAVVPPVDYAERCDADLR